MLRHITFVASALVSMGVDFAWAQDIDAAGERPESIEEVEVRGQRMSEIDFDLPAYVNEFIVEVSALPPGAGFARWHKSVCVGVNNLEASAAQYLIDRVALLADQVGLEPGEPGCVPQVLVIFTVDAKLLAAEMVEQNPVLFRPGGGSCCMTLGYDGLQTFVESDAAVRWWHVSEPVDAIMGERAVHTGKDGLGQYRWINVHGPSRIHNGLRDELKQVVIIVDGAKLQGTTWQQLGDYLAVVSLAQVNPKADPSSFDSILNLFSNPAAYSGLTDWDRTYIGSLYEIDLERFPERQRSAIVGRMVRRERQAASADEAATIR